MATFQHLDHQVQHLVDINYSNYGFYDIHTDYMINLSLVKY